MARLIPNQNTWVGFAATVSNIAAPTAAEVTAAINLTSFVISLNAASQGNTVPTPAFDSLFETSIVGTSQASFSGDFYRDNGSNNDKAWTTLPRNTNGFFIISRFGGSGTGKKPVAADVVDRPVDGYRGRYHQHRHRPPAHAAFYRTLYGGP